MNGIIVYEYNRQNINIIAEMLENKGYILMNMPLSDNMFDDIKSISGATKGIMIDVSNYYADDERALLYTNLQKK